MYKNFIIEYGNGHGDDDEIIESFNQIDSNKDGLITWKGKLDIVKILKDFLEI
jgi:Ca2+-binding EF-hand superfamily protein